VYTTLISTNAGFPPNQVCGKKEQFKASLSFEPHKGEVKNLFEYFSNNNVKTFLVNKNVNK
jgi:hypothetical protein